VIILVERRVTEVEPRNRGGISGWPANLAAAWGNQSGSSPRPIERPSPASLYRRPLARATSANAIAAKVSPRAATAPRAREQRQRSLGCPRSRPPIRRSSSCDRANHCRELVTISCRLPAQHTKSQEQQEPERTQPPDRLASVDSLAHDLLLSSAFSLAIWGRRDPFLSFILSRHLLPDEHLPAHRQQEAQRTQCHGEQMHLELEIAETRLLYELRNRLELHDVEKIGLAIVPASLAGKSAPRTP